MLLPRISFRSSSLDRLMFRKASPIFHRYLQALRKASVAQRPLTVSEPSSRSSTTTSHYAWANFSSYQGERPSPNQATKKQSQHFTPTDKAKDKSFTWWSG